MVSVAETSVATVRTEPTFRHGGQRFQKVFVNCALVRKEVKEGGRTFTNIADYLIKYHGYKNFDLVEGKRIEKEWWVTIRHKGLRERIFSHSTDGKVWQERKSA